MKTNVVYLGNCLDVLPTLPNNSVDSIVTDPPYELGFMGKSWDNSGIAYSIPMWKECLRVLKPGGHLLSFSGTRTYHRMAVAIEDAGFEVRDMIEWCYGSGFPKSLNIGKAVDKLQGNEREVLSTTIRTTHKKGISYKWANGNDTGICDNTKGTSEWEGWGTALKPAHEPICLARKPLAEKTVAENVLKYGTGGINIDESRVEAPNEDTGRNNKSDVMDTDTVGNWGMKAHNSTGRIGEGRFPANLITDGSEEVRECFPESKGALAPVKSGQKGFGGVIYGKYKEGGDDGATFYGDQSGNASRFFKSILYYPKASKSERNKGCEELEDKFRAGLAGADRDTKKELDDVSERFRTQPAKNNHPTVKPIALMSYLIKMITPKGGVVLEPFAGSGSTLVAAKENGFKYIGIELTEEYLPIIQARTGCEVIKNAKIVARKIQEEQGRKLEKALDIVTDKIFKKEVNKKQLCPTCQLYMKDGKCQYCK